MIGGTLLKKPEKNPSRPVRTEIYAIFFRWEKAKQPTKPNFLK
jgi:hypothetical protein